MILICFFVELFVVKFIFEVFLNLIVYLDIVEIKSSVKIMIDFIFGDRVINFGIKVIGFLWFFFLRVNFLMILSFFF